MTHTERPEHYKGKSVSEHLKEARLRGSSVSSETHGMELPGQLLAAADASRETSLLFLLLWTLFYPLHLLDTPTLFLGISFSIGWIVWRTGKCALLGYGRLDRLHRVIEEEQWEIGHHRQQEKDELRQMYAAKGFSGKLLDEVVDVLMADDNRLLQVMLEEELGLSLQAYEHPLKQAAGAFVGTVISCSVLVIAEHFWSWGGPIASFLLLITTTRLLARREKRSPLKPITWICAVALLSGSCIYFLTKLING